MSSVPVQVFTLSRFRVLRGGVPLESSAKAQRKPLELLKVLVALGGEQVPAEQIEDALWPDSDGEAANDALVTTLYRLRKLIGPETVVLHDHRLSIAPKHSSIDAIEFVSAASAAEHAIGSGEIDAAWKAVDLAMTLYGGPFLEGEFDPPEILTARHRLHARFLRTASEAARFFEAHGQVDRALSILRRGAEADGTSEELAQSLMRLLADTGRRGDALSTYQRLRDALSAGGGTAPSVETEALLRDIRHRSTIPAGIAPEAPPLGALNGPSVASSIPDGMGPLSPRPITSNPTAAWQWPALLALVGVTLAVGIVFALRAWVEPRTSRTAIGFAAEQKSIAVLPFENLSADPEQEYFADGLADDIITSLSKISRLTVIARESTYQFKNRSTDVRSIGRALGARFVLEGSVRREGDRVRVTAQLIDASTGGHIWADTYDRTLSEVFAVQDDIKSHIVLELGVKLSEGEQVRAWRRGTENLLAYEKLIKGYEQFLLNTPESEELAEGLAKEAIALDPDYPMAYVVWGYITAIKGLLGFDSNLAVSLDSAAEHGQKALEIDPELPDAYAMLGWVRAAQHRYDEGIDLGRKAVSLDPSRAKTHAVLAEILLIGGEYDESVDRMWHALRLNPLPPPWYGSSLMSAYLYGGHPAKTIEAAAKYLPLVPGEDRFYQVLYRMNLIASHALLNEMPEALRIAAELNAIAPEFRVDEWTAYERSTMKRSTDVERLRTLLQSAGLR